jgi:radical SAM protein with 4Fe4S-binding SPASM domain
MSAVDQPAAGTDGPPVQLMIELTSACNLRCPHCYVSAGDGRVRQLPARHLHELLGEFAALGGKRVTFSGGEPTIYPGWRPAIRYARFVGLDPCLLTNGTRLSTEDLDFLAGLDARVAVSLDAADPTVHDAVRGSGSFAKTLDVLRGLVDRGLGSRTTLCFTPMALNVGELAGVVALATRLGVATVYVSLLEDRGRASSAIEDLALSDDDKASLLFAVVSLRLRYPDVALDVPNLHLFPERLLGEELEAEAIDRTIRVTAEGDVYLSAYLEGAPFRLGRYRPGSLSGMWHSPRVRGHMLRASARRSLVPSCTRCLAWEWCRGGSAVLAWAANGTFFGVDGFCAAKRRLVAELDGSSR